MPDIFSFLQGLKIKIWFKKAFKNIDIFLKCFFFYLAFVGIFGYSVFIMQEGAQLLSFSNFSASDTRQYALLRQNIDYMSEINKSIRFFTKYFLWMIPPQHKSYFHYANSIELYVETLRAEILANDPSVYLNEHISLTFKYNSFKKAKNGLWIASNGKVKVILISEPESKSIEISGILRADPDKAGGVILVAE